MKNLTVIKKNDKFLVDSREVAEMVGKEHKNLLRDINGYAEILTAQI
jgi:phage regulator Rha-like protein